MSTLTCRWSFANLAFLVLLGACNDLELVDAFGGASSIAAGGSTSNPSLGGTTSSGLGGKTTSSSTTGGSSYSSAGGAPSGGLSAVASGGTVPALAAGGTSSQNSSTAVAATGGLIAATGGSKGTATGGATTGGSIAMATGGVATGGRATGGDGSGGVAPSGGAPSSGGTKNVGGSTATGGLASGGASVAASGGAPSSGGAPASGGATPTGSTVTTGGVATGGTSATGGAATGGALTGGASATGGSPSQTTTPTSTGGNTSVASATTGGTISCPSPISKPASLLAVEPAPDNPCARVTNVIKQGEGYYAFGYTNGEVWVMFTSSTVRFQRVDLWAQSGMHFALPLALVTALYAPQNNFDGALAVGYADPEAAGIVPWYAGRAGYAWSAGSTSPTGTVLGISACPFHGYGTHLGLLVPWSTEESTTSSYVFSTGNSSLNQHLKLANTTYVTAIELMTTSNGWRVIAGTGGGEIYITNLLTGSITWDETSQTLSKPVTWTRITDSRMPAKWVTRIAVNPSHPERIFATFGSFEPNALWFSDDSGQTWSNRHANLPTASNPDIAPPIIGASFNPFLDGAAYVVTPQSAYFTLDYGASGWSEW